MEEQLRSEKYQLAPAFLTISVRGGRRDRGRQAGYGNPLISVGYLEM